MERVMNWENCEPTLGDILSDPATRALMRADGLKRRELESQLKDIGRVIARRSASSGSMARIAREKRRLSFDD
jgi:hypothetical protein